MKFIIPSMRDWLRLLLPESRGVIGVILAYFDDTGTHANSPVVGFGGLFGNGDSWTDFDAQWRAKLQCPLPGKGPLRRFHMTECMARDQEFQGYSETECEAVIHNFRQIIMKCSLWGYSMIVARKDWDEIIAERYCFGDVVFRMTQFIDQHSPDPDLSIVFDKRTNNPDDWAAYFQQASDASDLRTNLAGVSFLDNRKFPPLQAADMWVWEMFKLASDNLANDSLQMPRQLRERLR